MQEENTLAMEWADFIIGTNYDNLPPNVAHYVKRNILNNLGCVLGGKGVKSSDVVVEVVSELGGKPESSVLGYKMKTSCANAAFANAIVGYALEMNDDHRLGTQHPVIAIAPTVMALGERKGARGKEIIVAQALGSELSIRVGETFLGFMYDQGFHPTGTCATFGATAAAGKILGLSKDEIVNAFGIAGSAAAGMSTVTIGSGVWTKRFQGGHPAMSGIIAALLGQKGFKGSAQIFEGVKGKGGFVKSHSFQNKYDLTKITNQLGKKWELLDTSVKVHACCAYLAPVVDSALEIASKYDVSPEDVQEVKVKVCQQLIDTLMFPEERKYAPRDVVDAQFSIPYGVGVAICRRLASPAEFTDEVIKDPQILAVASKVKAELDPVAEERYPDDKLATVVVKTKDGKEYSALTEYPRGDVENPVSDAELEQKFRMLTKKALSDKEATQVIDLVWKLEEMEDINRLIELVRG